MPPPDDSVFGDPQPDATPAARAPESTPEPAAPAGVDPSRIEAMEAQMAQVNSNLQGMNQFFQQLSQRVEEVPVAGQAPPQAQPDDWNERFYADPKGTIDQQFEQRAAEVITPTAESLGSMIIEQQRQSIDSQWGEGAWDEVYAPVLDGVVDRLKRTNPSQLLNKSAIENAVATVTGRNVQTLVERKGRLAEQTTTTQGDEVKKLVDATAEAVISRTNLTGGLRRSPAGGPAKLTPEQESILDVMKKDTGQSEDPERLASLVDLSNPGGTTLESWQKTTSKKDES